MLTIFAAALQLFKLYSFLLIRMLEKKITNFQAIIMQCSNAIPQESLSFWLFSASDIPPINHFPAAEDH